MTFCPFTKEECRDDCALADVEYTISDDGVKNETFCAFTVIAGYCLNESEESHG